MVRPRAALPHANARRRRDRAGLEPRAGRARRPAGLWPVSREEERGKGGGAGPRRPPLRPSCSTPGAPIITRLTVGSRTPEVTMPPTRRDFLATTAAAALGAAVGRPLAALAPRTAPAQPVF